ncbi:hypothetical protein J6590_106431, partial [Homalodisca vitripennis]
RLLRHPKFKHLRPQVLTPLQCSATPSSVTPPQAIQDHPSPNPTVNIGRLLSEEEIIRL